MERELDYLIDNLSETLHYPSAHRSRYLTHTYEESREERTMERRSNAHRDQLYNKYGKFTGSSSPRMPNRSTNDPNWYRFMAREMGHPRSPTPILKNTSRSETRSPTLSRAASQMSLYSSKSDLRSRPTSPACISAARPYSPYLLPQDLQGNRSVSPASRSVSPKRHHEKSVVIGPITDMVTKRQLSSNSKQEYYRHRDAHQGKPIGGRHGFMTYSWPYGLDLISDEYLWSKRKAPAESPPAPRAPPVPIHRRARSVEPPVNINRTPEPPVDFDITNARRNQDLNSNMRHLRHIVVEQVPVPVPPKFGTLTHGGRSANSAMSPFVDGPPCELCHKPINEGRCISAENAQYHCWHFVCSFCFKTLKQHDFVMAEDNKPYCLNCFKRSYP